ncbi:uncharacterized protein LOC142505593 [Primulina tabacum]|uniref:uncharacterized protein LOC142505593 n=1 Tax=Primulina tabacum TaxID=48773 RepID=UPI003F598EC3
MSHAFWVKECRSHISVLNESSICEAVGGNIELYVDDILELPVLVKPKPGEKLFVYLSTTEYVVSSVLIREEGSDQKPMYYVSHTLIGVELRYSEVEKIYLALVMIAWKLRHYFLLHPIIMLINSPLGRIMTHPEVSGKMVAIKAKDLSDFLSKMIKPVEEEVWRVFVDGAASLAGCGVGVVIKGVYGGMDEKMIKYLKSIKIQTESFVD